MMEFLLNPAGGVVRYAVIAIVLIGAWAWRLYHFIDRF